MRVARKFLAFLASFVCLSSFGHAATIRGTVKGPDGSPFEGAFVGAQNSKTKITVSVLSDRQGHSQVQNLPAGDYELRIRAVGYKADPRTSLMLSGEQNASADFVLQNGTVRWSDISLYQGQQL